MRVKALGGFDVAPLSERYRGIAGRGGAGRSPCMPAFIDESEASRAAGLEAVRPQDHVDKIRADKNGGRATKDVVEHHYDLPALRHRRISLHHVDLQCGGALGGNMERTRIKVREGPRGGDIKIS
jgi:hypothetical protein